MDNNQKFIDDYGNLSQQVKILQETDPILDELISDYQTLLRDLKAAERRADAADKSFLRDARDSLRALDLEIRERLSGAENAQRK